MNVIDIPRSNEKVIKERFSLRRIGLFGSFVRGEELETSDVDILVEFEEPYILSSITSINSCGEEAVTPSGVCLWAGNVETS